MGTPDRETVIYVSRNVTTGSVHLGRGVEQQTIVELTKAEAERVLASLCDLLLPTNLPAHIGEVTRYSSDRAAKMNPDALGEYVRIADVEAHRAATEAAIRALCDVLNEDAAGVPAWELLTDVAYTLNRYGGGTLADRCALLAGAIQERADALLAVLGPDTDTEPQ